MNEGQTLKAIIIAAGGDRAWEKFTADYRQDGAGRMSGDDIQKWQQEWCMKTENMEKNPIDLYDEAARLLQATGSPTIHSISSNKADVRKVFGGFAHNIKIFFSSKNPPSPDEIMKMYDIKNTEMKRGDTVTFFPETGVIAHDRKSPTGGQMVGVAIYEPHSGERPSESYLASAE